MGENAPTNRESAGIIASDSLAAESTQSGGAFAGNNASVTSKTALSSHDPASTTPHEAPGSQQQQQQHREQGQAAPTYVNNQYIRDQAGPHGKNITEDPEMTGSPGKFNVEVGSMQDPGRVAEQTMRLKQTRGAPGTGEREVGERGAQDAQPYGALKETEA